MHEGKPISSTVGKVFKKCLNSASLPKKNYNKEQKTVETEKKTDSENKDVDQIILKEVKECVDNMLQKIEEQDEKKTVQETVVAESVEDRKSELHN